MDQFWGARSSPRIAVIRASTRATFPSSTESGTSYAMLSTAAAVYAPMPGRGEGGFEIARECRIVLRHNFLRRSVQVARAAVVAEAGPIFQYFRLSRLRECGEIWKAREKFFVVGNHRPRCALLQHHLRNPYAIRIARRPPRQFAPVFCEPLQQMALQFLRFSRRICAGIDSLVSHGGCRYWQPAALKSAALHLKLNRAAKI